MSIDVCIACLTIDCHCAACGAPCAEDCQGPEHDRVSVRERDALKRETYKLMGLEEWK